MDLLRIGVLASGAWALLALGGQMLRTRSYGKRESFAPPAGPAWRGIVYALGPGISPSAKESTRRHLPVYFVGVGYHLGIFAGLLILLALIVGVPPVGLSLDVVRVLSLIGAACGVTLLLRRSLTSHLRSLSCPDDVVANLLATTFSALAFTRTVFPAAEPSFLATAIILLLYVPLGKIRHCVFFFATRYYAGAHFGRRGTYPPHA